MRTFLPPTEQVCSNLPKNFEFLLTVGGRRGAGRRDHDEMETDTSSCGGGGAKQRGIGLVEVQAAAAALRRSEVFHVVKELVGFVLYMHHQIPS